MGNGGRRGIAWVVVSVVIIIACGIALAWFFDMGKDASSRPSYSGQMTHISIGNIGEFSIFNLIAKDLGFFAEHGLDAEITEYSAGPAALEDLLAGKVDVAVAADFVGVTTLFSNPEVRIIAETSRHNVFNLVTRVDHGIHEARDIKGKKIGVTRGSAGEFYLGRFLTIHSLSFADIILIDLSPGDIVAQLENGTIDAAVTFNPHIFNLKKKLGEKVDVWPAQDTQKTFALVYSSKDYINANPGVVERYIQALADAESYIKEHPAESKALLVRDMGYSPEYVEFSWSNFKHMLGLDQELLLSMENQANWLIKNKFTTATTIPNYLDSIYFSALMSVKPESVHIIH